MAHLCTTCEHREPLPAACKVNAPAASKARRGETVQDCASYAGTDGTRALSEAVPPERSRG